MQLSYPILLSRMTDVDQVRDIPQGHVPLQEGEQGKCESDVRVLIQCPHPTMHPHSAWPKPTLRKGEGDHAPDSSQWMLPFSTLGKAPINGFLLSYLMPKPRKIQRPIILGYRFK